MNGLFYDYFNSSYILISSKLSILIKPRESFSVDISRYRKVRYPYSPLVSDGIAISPTLFAIFINLKLLIEICGLIISFSIIGALLSFVILVLLAYLVN